MIIGGDPVFEKCGIYGNCIYLSVIQCLYFIKQRSMGILEKQMRVKRETNIERNEDIWICDDMGKHQQDMLQDKIQGKSMVNVLRQEVNKNERKEPI